MTDRSDLPLEQIAKLADDIRVITNFSENHNFDGSLLKASLTPSDSQEKRLLDWPLYILLGSIVFVVAVLGVLKFVDLAQEMSEFLFIVGLLFCVSATMCAHLRFENITTTLIVAIGLFLILFIGAGVLTPMEAIENVKELK